jgi:hypothetical protein
MTSRTSAVLNAFGRGSNCKDPADIKDLWLIGTGLYFLEFATADSSGEFCFDASLFSVEGSPFAPFCTQVPGSDDMTLMYIPGGVRRITSENVLERVLYLFSPTGEQTKLYTKPHSLKAHAYRSAGDFLSIGISPVDEEQLEVANV